MNHHGFDRAAVLLRRVTFLLDCARLLQIHTFHVLKRHLRLLVLIVCGHRTFLVACCLGKPQPLVWAFLRVLSFHRVLVIVITARDIYISWDRMGWDGIVSSYLREVDALLYVRRSYRFVRS